METNPERSAVPHSGNRGSARKRVWLLLSAGALVGFFYGLFMRLTMTALSNSARASMVMTLGFMCFVPFAMGFVTVFIVERSQRQSVAMWALLPWVPLATGLVATMIMLLEGAICVVMFAPLGMMLSTLGGVCGGMAARILKSKRSRALSMGCVMALPFLMAPWEKPVLYKLEVRKVENQIEIEAPASVVWQNIKTVPAISPEELPDSWTSRIGFPDPIAATLSHEGIGGVRRASFSGGVLFLEKVDVWEPERRLAFSIAAQTDLIPPTTLDEHVRVGGPFFDVLRGEYVIEQIGNGRTRLRLSSQDRLSTDFNWYARLWTDAVMSDLQKRILKVVKQRCEKERTKKLVL